MKRVKMTLTFAQDAVDELRAVAASEGFVSPQMLAVYDILAPQIRVLRSQDQGRQSVTEQRRGNGT